MKLRADLHIHSCLSPCASLRLSPREIVRRAGAAGLDAVALTDHNCARHAPLMARLCRAAGLVFVPGVEATTNEEIHVLCLFARADAALEFGEHLYARLPPVRCIPEKMGDQAVVDADDVLVGSPGKFLVNATDLTLTELVGHVAAAGGLAIPAHVDRPSSGLLGRLGYLPPLPFPTLEVSPHYDRQADPAGLARAHRLVTGSDAHEPEDVGRAFALLDVERRSATALLQALRAPVRPEIH